MRLGFQQVIEIGGIAEISDCNTGLELCSANRYRYVKGCGNVILAKLNEGIEIGECGEHLVEEYIKIKHTVLVEICSVDRNIINLSKEYLSRLLGYDLYEILEIYVSVMRKINDILSKLSYVNSCEQIVLDKSCKSVFVNSGRDSLDLFFGVEASDSFNTARRLYYVSNAKAALFKNICRRYLCEELINKLLIVGKHLGYLVKADILYYLLHVNVLPVIVNINICVVIKGILENVSYVSVIHNYFLDLIVTDKSTDIVCMNNVLFNDPMSCNIVLCNHLVKRYKSAVKKLLRGEINAVCIVDILIIRRIYAVSKELIYRNIERRKRLVKIYHSKDVLGGDKVIYISAVSDLSNYRVRHNGIKQLYVREHSADKLLVSKEKFNNVICHKSIKLTLKYRYDKLLCQKRIIPHKKRINDLRRGNNVHKRALEALVSDKQLHYLVIDKRLDSISINSREHIVDRDHIDYLVSKIKLGEHINIKILSYYICRDLINNRLEVIYCYVVSRKLTQIVERKSATLSKSLENILGDKLKKLVAAYVAVPEHIVNFVRIDLYCQHPIFKRESIRIIVCFGDFRCRQCKRRGAQAGYHEHREYHHNGKNS